MESELKESVQNTGEQTDGYRQKLAEISHELEHFPALKGFVTHTETYHPGRRTVYPWQVQHDAQEPLGFLLYSKTQKEKVLFATDTYYIPNTFKDLNLIFVECNYDPQILEKRIQSGQVVPSMARRLLQSHFNLEHVKDFFHSNDLSKVRQIYLIHISKGNGDPAAFQKAIMQLTGKPVMMFG